MMPSKLWSEHGYSSRNFILPIISAKRRRIAFSVNSSPKGSNGIDKSLNHMALGRQEQLFM